MALNPMANEQEFTMLKQLKADTDFCTIKVKIHLMWDSYYQDNRTSKSAVDMILEDEKGDRILANVKKYLLGTFERLLKEGSAFLISNFGITSNGAYFKVVDNEHKICPQMSLPKLSIILPVITKGSRQDIVNAALNSSYLWTECKVLRLTTNMRLQTGSSGLDQEALKDFADWILDIGEGNLGGENDGEAEIEFPKDVLINSNGDHVLSMTDTIYPDINDHLYDENYFQERAILVPTNEEVDYINDYMLSNMVGEETTYLSSDVLSETEMSSSFEHTLYSPEILNSIKISGFPHHKLSLKIGAPVMLLRNVDQANDLCNGTRLQVIKLGTHVIEAKVITGKNVGSFTYIPRMKMIPSDPTVPVKFKRRQFPLMVCFVMTINKSQGQSLSKVGLFLREQIFSHGQLYVAVSRVTSKSDLKVLITDKDGNLTNKTMNVVYKEVLQNI